MDESFPQKPCKTTKGYPQEGVKPNPPPNQIPKVDRAHEKVFNMATDPIKLTAASVHRVSQKDTVHCVVKLPCLIQFMSPPPLPIVFASPIPSIGLAE